MSEDGVCEEEEEKQSVQQQVNMIELNL